LSSAWCAEARLANHRHCPQTEPSTNARRFGRPRPRVQTGRLSYASH
jgi:hypothetical protein